MKKKSLTGKLKVRKETVLRLLDQQLGRVQGGEEQRSDISNNCCDPTQTTT